MRRVSLRSWFLLACATAIVGCLGCGSPDGNEDLIYRSQAALARLGVVIASVDPKPDTFSSLHVAALKALPDLGADARATDPNPLPRLLPGSSYGRLEAWDNEDDPSQTPILWTVHTDRRGRRVVLFLDGNVYVLDGQGKDMGYVVRCPNFAKMVEENSLSGQARHP